MTWARDLLTSYTAQENHPLSLEITWAGRTAAAKELQTCGDLFIISPRHCARLSHRKIRNLRKVTFTAPVLSALGQTAELLRFRQKCLG